MPVWSGFAAFAAFCAIACATDQSPMPVATHHAYHGATVAGNSAHFVLRASTKSPAGTEALAVKDVLASRTEPNPAIVKKKQTEIGG